MISGLRWDQIILVRKFIFSCLLEKHTSVCAVGDFFFYLSLKRREKKSFVVMNLFLTFGSFGHSKEVGTVHSHTISLKL